MGTNGTQLRTKETKRGISEMIPIENIIYYTSPILFITIGYLIARMIDIADRKLIGDVYRMDTNEKIPLNVRMTLFLRRKAIEKRIKRIRRKNYGEEYRKALIQEIMNLCTGDNPVFEEITIKENDKEQEITEQLLYRMSTERLIEVAEDLVKDLEKIA